MGTKTPINFVYGPPGLRTLQSLPAKDIFLALNDDNDIVTWNSRSGSVLHYVNHQDLGKSLSQECIFGADYV